MLRKHGTFKLPNNDSLFEIEENQLNTSNHPTTAPIPIKPVKVTPPNNTTSTEAIPVIKKIIKDNSSKRITISMTTKLPDSDSEDSDTGQQVKSVKFK